MKRAFLPAIPPKDNLGWLVIALFFGLSTCRPSLISAPSTESIEELFARPPASARPWVNWFWVDGNITPEGITADLEAMQRVGIGGALLMDVSQEIPPGPVRFGTPQWHAAFQHTVSEAARLGLEISMNNAPGWCGSGGPWIPPELAMQKVVWNSTNLAGPTVFEGPLPKLQATLGYSRDIATIAFPTIVGDGARLPGFAPKLTSSENSNFDGARLLDGDYNTTVLLPLPKPGKTQFIQLEFADAFMASQLRLTRGRRSQSFEGILEASNDGKQYTLVRAFHERDGGVLAQFEPRSARYFRVVFNRATSSLDSLEFSELELIPIYRIESHQAKAGLGPWASSNRPIAQVPSYSVARPETILDLTTNTTADGRLIWTVPKGQWTVIRFGYTPTGMPNHPIGVEGSGLECDKLSREAIVSHFSAFLAKLISEAGVAAGRTLVATHVDSWEIGYQNWTPRFREEFLRRRGYDLLRYLPTFTGRFVDTPEVSERFLWDVRRTIADLLADNYAGRLAQLAHEHGMKLSIEAYANGPFDSLLYAGRADVPMSEFWNERDDFSRFYRSWVMASAAHTYGKPIVAAEAFTSYPVCAKWQNHPFSLKALGDAAFCEGVNRLVFHRYAHQPWLDRKPGMTMGPWGAHYERTETWWEQSKAWHEYLSRCQFLLQQGVFAADICYVTEEGAYVEPPAKEKLKPAPPTGYAFDITTPEVVMTRMSVQNGRVTLPEGVSYQLLVLPETKTITPDLLRRIKVLEMAGATVLGTKPTAAPGLANYPACDREVQRLADELWAGCDGRSAHEHRLGEGRIVCGASPGDVLRKLNLPPDFEQLTQIPGHPLRWIHRKINGADFYFIANSNAQPATVECAFRVAGKQPEFWHPDTGEEESAPVWQAGAAVTRVRLELDQSGSVFVVFAKSSKATDPIVSTSRDGRPDDSLKMKVTRKGTLELQPVKAGHYEFVTASGKHYTTDVTDVPKEVELVGPWDLRFPPASGAPEHVTLTRLISWTEHKDPGVKYFSGRASYSMPIQIPEQWMTTNQIVVLDLGRVEVMAELKINGKDLGVFWKPPFQVDVTSSLRPGNNELEVSVVNLWPNRLIGDEQLPPDCRWAPAQGDNGAPLAEWPAWLQQGKRSPTGRLTFATWKHWNKDDRLLESGLIGPVALRVVRVVELEKDR